MDYYISIKVYNVVFVKFKASSVKKSKFQSFKFAYIESNKCIFFATVVYNRFKVLIEDGTLIS